MTWPGPSTSELRQEAQLEQPIVAALKRAGEPMTAWDVLRALKAEGRVAARVAPQRAVNACRALEARGILRAVGNLRHEAIDDG